jgi:hypothetical protein
MLDNLDIRIKWVEDEWDMVNLDENGEYYEVECTWDERDETLNREYSGWDDGFDNVLPHLRRGIFALISMDGEKVVWKDSFEDVIKGREDNHWVLFTLFELQKCAKKQSLKGNSE